MRTDSNSILKAGTVRQTEAKWNKNQHTSNAAAHKHAQWCQYEKMNMVLKRVGILLRKLVFCSGSVVTIQTESEVDNGPKKQWWRNSSVTTCRTSSQCHWNSCATHQNRFTRNPRKKKGGELKITGVISQWLNKMATIKIHTLETKKKTKKKGGEKGSLCCALRGHGCVWASEGVDGVGLHGLVDQEHESSDDGQQEEL